MSELFLNEEDFPSYTIIKKAATNSLMSLFDFRTRGARCRGLVSYVFDEGKELQALEELIAQFGELDNAEAFMQDEKHRLARVGTLIALDIADENLCVITPEHQLEEGEENYLHAWCTVRDGLIVIRLMISIATTGDDLQIPTIKDYVEKALKRVQRLKV